jgi:hypothetical protein
MILFCIVLYYTCLGGGGEEAGQGDLPGLVGGEGGLIPPADYGREYDTYLLIEYFPQFEGRSMVTSLVVSSLPANKNC